MAQVQARLGSMVVYQRPDAEVVIATVIGWNEKFALVASPTGDEHVPPTWLLPFPVAEHEDGEP